MYKKLYALYERKAFMLVFGYSDEINLEIEYEKKYVNLQPKVHQFLLIKKKQCCIFA